MALTERQMQHPRFWAFNDTANKALIDAAKAHGFTTADLATAEAHAGRIVDEITALLLRLEKQK